MKNLITLFLIFYSVMLFAQTPHNNHLVINTGGKFSFTELKPRPKATKGSVYYSENWMKGSIKLFTGEEIENYPLKYDLKKYLFEIKSGEEIKILSIAAIKEVTWMNNLGQDVVLKNVKNFDNAKGYGMFEVIAEGKYTLLKRTKLDLLNGNYNTALDVGSRDKKYIRNDEYFIAKDNSVIPIRKSRRSILKKMGGKADKVKAYAKQNSLSFKKENDLAKIFNYCNSI